MARTNVGNRPSCWKMLLRVNKSPGFGEENDSLDIAMKTKAEGCLDLRKSMFRITVIILLVIENLEVKETALLGWLI